MLAEFASSRRWSATTTSRWTRRRCPKRRSSTASTCCAPTASCPPSRWRYREPWKVEQIFRTTKAVLETRPVHHAGDAAIRGHLFTSFLALVLRKELQDRLQAVELDLDKWQDVIADLDRVVETTVDQRGRRSCCATKRPAVPEQCSRPLVSPRRPRSDARNRKVPPPRRPDLRPQNLASAASHPVRVVPRRPRKNEIRSITSLSSKKSVLK